MDSTVTVNRALVAFVPSPHRGYLDMFRRYKGDSLLVLGTEFVQEFPSLVRFLPAASPEDVCAMVWSLGIFKSVHVLRPKGLDRLRHMSVVMPDEDVSHAFAEKHLSGVDVVFDGSWRLRWDWGRTMKEVRQEEAVTITHEELHRQMLHATRNAAQKSPDWWRQVGAVLVRSGELLLSAYNRHMPHEQSLYLEGDPRSNFNPPGSRIEMSAAGHGESLLTAAAAKRGISMEGCDLYVSTFPCPACAYLLSETGIRRLFYGEGYSLIAGAEALRNKEIELIRVDMTQSPS